MVSVNASVLYWIKRRMSYFDNHSQKQATKSLVTSKDSDHRKHHVVDLTINMA